MNEEQILELLKQKLQESGKTRGKFAVENIGCCESFLFDVLAGRRHPGNKICAYLGIEKTTTYAKRK
jgi:hypothetical protein